MQRWLAVLLAWLAVPLAAETVDHVETELTAPESRDHSRPAWPIRARLSTPTDRYDHDVLGGLPPWTVLEVGAVACGACRHGSETVQILLPDELVFEDVAPRLWDVTGDGRPEIVVVESHVQKGARLAVWTYSDIGADLTRLATTDFIGTRHRWLAPAGAADFDGDGRILIAYVDRPHILGDLVFVQLDGDRLVETARLPGLTNHRIGDDVISGGLRDCGQGPELGPELEPELGPELGPELVLASLDWTRMLRVKGGVVEDIGPIPPKGLTIPPC